MFSPVDPHILYFASNVLFKTTDGGNSWETISKDLTRENPGVPASVGSLIPKGAEKQRGVIYALAPSFKNVATLWAGTDDGLIWITRDAGKTWSDITPKGAEKQRGVIYALAPSFKNVATLWAGTDDGLIWITRDAGKTWSDITP